MGWIAPIAVAAQQAEEEREMMAKLQAEHGDGFEFKMVRSYGVAFGGRDKFQALVAEEQRAGWELVGTLDSGRLFFKRPVSAREMDHLLPDDYNPYRTEDGGYMVLLVVMLVIAVMLAVGIAIFVVVT